MPSQLESSTHAKLRNRGTQAHFLFQRTFNVAFKMLQNVQEGRVVALVGPSRAGKSLLQTILIDELRRGLRPEHGDDIPILRIEADLSDRQRMNLKAFTIDALTALKHPVFLDWGDLKEDERRIKARIPETDLRPMLVKALKARKTLYLFVDEAHHLLMTHRGQLRSDILDSLKNICNKANVVLVLFGGYTLLNGLFHSAHLNGRLDLIHFPPYTSSEEGLEEFASVLASIQENFPLHDTNLLIDRAATLREWCWGTFGGAMDLIRSADARRLAEKAKYLEFRHFEAARLPAKPLLVLTDDVRDGMRFFDSDRATSAQATRVVDRETTRPVEGQAKSHCKKCRTPFKKNPQRRKPPSVRIK